METWSHPIMNFSEPVVVFWAWVRFIAEEVEKARLPLPQRQWHWAFLRTYLILCHISVVSRRAYSGGCQLHWASGESFIASAYVEFGLEQWSIHGDGSGAGRHGRTWGNNALVNLFERRLDTTSSRVLLRRSHAVRKKIRSTSTTDFSVVCCGCPLLKPFAHRPTFQFLLEEANSQLHSFTCFDRGIFLLFLNSEMVSKQYDFLQFVSNNKLQPKKRPTIYNRPIVMQEGNCIYLHNSCILWKYSDQALWDSRWACSLSRNERYSFLMVLIETYSSRDAMNSLLTLYWLLAYVTMFSSEVNYRSKETARTIRCLKMRKSATVRPPRRTPKSCNLQ